MIRTNREIGVSGHPTIKGIMKISKEKKITIDKEAEIHIPREVMTTGEHSGTIRLILQVQEEKMKLSKYRETGEYFSGKASEIVRQLILAGIAIIWVFKIKVGNADVINAF